MMLLLNVLRMYLLNIYQVYYIMYIEQGIAIARY